METRYLKVALNVQLPQDGTLPDWVELIPAGDVIVGRDKRRWTNPTPDQVVEAFSKNNADLPIDWEHATEMKAPRGEKAPAAGWIKEMELRDDAVMARVEWTKDGAEDVENRRYRYLSPVFLYTVKNRVITRITSAALTNQPNLHLTALNREETQTKEEKGMDFFKAICAALGLADGTTEEQAVDKVTAMKGDLATAENRAHTPSLEKFVPRGDYDAAMNRAANAENTLKEHEEKVRGDEIDIAINQALENGKITPASKDYHKAQCRTEGGMDRFKSFLETAPVLGGDTDLDKKDLNSGKAGLNDEEKAVCSQLGIPEDEYQKTKKEIS